MTDWEKREKVIKGLEKAVEVFDGRISGPMFEMWMDETKDALALLKEQEPRVLTLEEALNSLVIEYRSGKLQEIGKRVFTEGFEYYGDLWRVWDRMPTDEQREKEPWDDAER